MAKWSVYLPEKLGQSAAAIAKKESRTRSALVGEALLFYVRRFKKAGLFEESPRLKPKEIVGLMAETGLYGRRFLEDLERALVYADKANK